MKTTHKTHEQQNNETVDMLTHWGAAIVLTIVGSCLIDIVVRAAMQ